MLSLVTIAALIRPAQADHASATSSSRGRHQPGEALAVSQLQPPAPIHINLGTDSTPCAKNPVSRVILVSITLQRVWMCQRTTQVYSTPVTTGAINVGDGTPVGTWQIQAKQTDRYLVGSGYRDFVHYWMPFNGDFGFHDSPWQTMAYGAAGYRANGSHGCVHLPADAMAWLYHWAPVGTAVTIEP